MDKYFQENKPVAGLGRASLHSSVIALAAKGIGIVSQVVSMIVLARLLSPHDVGLTATIFALIAFGPMLVDLGTSEATSQKTHITEAEVTSLFWLNVAIGLVLTIVFAASSGFIAAVYGEPALSGIALAASLTFVTAGFSTQHSALLRRAMQFRSLAVIDICANLLSSVLSIVMALTGWGYWALVVKNVSMPVLTLAGVWISCPWIPGRPQLTAEAKTSVRFGLGVAGFTMTDSIAQSADRLAIGYFFGAGALGYYQNAFLFYTDLLNLLVSPLHNIAVSSLSKLKNNLEEFRRSWNVALSTLSFLSALAFAVLAVTGPDLIAILLGQKWAASGPLLCIFAVRGIAQAVERTLGWLHVPTGRSDRWMRWGFFSAIGQVLAVAAGLPFGLIGVTTTCAIAAYILFLPALIYAGRPAGIRTNDVLAAVGPQTVAGLITVALGLTIRELFLADIGVFARFFLSSVICTSVYLVVAIVIFRVTEPLRLGLSVLRDFNPIRSLRSS